MNTVWYFQKNHLIEIRRVYLRLIKKNLWIQHFQYGIFFQQRQKKIGHPAPFPEELVDRFINLYSYKYELILDPFMGSGTTALAALNSNRKYIGYEINKEYCDLANKRIKDR